MAIFNNDLSDIGGVSVHPDDLSDIGGTPVLPPQNPQNQSLMQGLISRFQSTNIPRVAGDIGAGLAQGAIGLDRLLGYDTPILNLMHVQRPTDQQISQLFGVNNPTLVDKLAQGAVSYAPFGPMGDVAKVAEGLPFLSKLAMKGLQQAIPGAAYGYGQTGTLAGAATGAATNAGMSGLGTLAGKIPLNKNAIGNYILSKLPKLSQNGAALTPEEAAENLQKNYTDINGNPVNIDIGTLTNNPALKNIYEAGKFIPGTGVSKNINLINKQISDKAINDIQNKIDIENNQQPINDIHAQLQDIGNQQSQNSAAINQAPTFLDQLASGVNDRANITSELKNSTTKLYKNNKDNNSSLYAPINNSKLRFDTLGIDNPFQNYGSAARTLLAQRDNLSNLFSDDSDLGRNLNGELDKAQSFINNQNNFGSTLPEVVQRIQNIGKLAASANSQGKRYEGMLLNNLRDGLSTDADTALRNSGNSDLANQLQIANTDYKNNVLPFYKNNEIRKAVTDNSYIPAKAKLANALHDPNNQTILNQLPNNYQNASLYQLMTGGKGKSSGFSNMSAKDIASAYAKVPLDAKRAVASYNPDADKYFENLPSTIDNNVQLQAMQKALSSQAQNLAKNKQANLANLQKQIDAIKQQKYGVNRETSPLASKAILATKLGALGGAGYTALSNPLTGAAAIPMSLLARHVTKALSNPDLINSYINGTKLPVTKSFLGQYAQKAFPSFVTPSIVNLQGGQ